MVIRPMHANKKEMTSATVRVTEYLTRVGCWYPLSREMFFVFNFYSIDLAQVLLVQN